MPSCILACFGSTGSEPEVESSHFSVGKSAGPSNAACSGVLSSFLSKWSGSRATMDNCATDTTKTRVMAIKTSGADIVTMATARYLELFAAAPKNDEAASPLSEPRVGQESMRVVCTASEFHVSRSSTLTAMGRTSREASRLAGAHQHQVQHSANLATVPTLLAQRRSASSTRSGPHFPLPEPPASPTAAISEPAQPPASQIQPAPAPRKHLQLTPFTNKTRSLADTSRSRSDRLSPSAAACLLPSPSIKSIARAHTALTATSAGSTGLVFSASAGDLLQDGASGGSAANGPMVHATGGGNRSSALMRASTGNTPSPSAAAAAPTDTKLPAPMVRRSRLHTESGSSGPVASIRGPGSTTGAMDSSASGQPSSRNPLHVLMSSASGRIRTAPPSKRASIHFCRDGNVAVTGLPPSCLTAGRAPRRKDTSGRLTLAGGLRSGPECSGFLLGSTGAAPGVHTGECGFCLGASVAPEVVQAMFLGSHSHDSGSRCPLSRELAQAGHGASFGGLTNMVPPMVARTPRVEEANDGAALVGGKQAADCTDTGAAHVQRPEPSRREEQQQQQQQQAAKEKCVQDGANLLELAVSSTEGQRCDWAGSSMYLQSHCSNSIRLPHGMTAGTMTATKSQLSHNMMSDKLAASHVVDAAVENVTVTATLRAAGDSRDPPQLPTLAEPAGPQNDHIMTTAEHTDADASFGGFQAGCLGTELSTMIGSSAMNEPTDVTSALTRLQEACMAAVAQGDMRSQRLTNRNSAELSSFLLQMHQHRSVGVDGYTEQGSNQIVGTVGAGGLKQPRVCAGTVERSSSVRNGGNVCPPVARTSSAHVPVAAQAQVRSPLSCPASQRTGTDACRSTAPSPAQPNTAADAVAASGNGTTRATDDQQWVADSRTGRNSSRRIGIAMDGQRREPATAGTLDSAAVPSGGAGRGQLAEDGADAAAEEYRTRLLNVLLRGDFLYDTCESAVPCSDDDDDGVVEYRYGGFELGGGESDYSFRRQASFMEAVRSCAMLNPASNIAAGAGAGVKERSTPPSAPGAP